MRSSPWILFVVLSLVAWLVPGAPAQGTPPGDRPLEIPSDYKLGPEDVISVVTRDVPELSGDFLIRLDGKFTMPIIGDVEAAGLTVTELKYRLEQALRRELREPQVTVNVKQMRLNRVYVLGAVGRPSIIDYRPGWRLTEAIAAVGGLANLPERLRALVIRGGKTTVVELREIFIDGKNESNLLLQPGDVISIQSDATIRVNILGPVGRPGLVTILEGQGIVEAL
ncbi:MAG: polysaccharide export protein, partial [Armatimonadetes bacterium]|nr:polysaccharide export protein [Armatimonadota bacterium]